MTKSNPRFTQHAQEAVQSARADAAKRGHGRIEPGHILLAILNVPKCAAVVALHNLSVNLANLRKDCANLLHPQKAALPETQDNPFSEESKKVLAFAVTEASHMHDSFVGTEHLLLGLAHEYARLRDSPFRPISGGIARLRKSVQETMADRTAKAPFGEANRRPVGPEEDVAIAMSKVLGIPFASFENKILKMEVGQELDKTIPEAFARQNLVLPLFRDEGTLAVAVANPDNLALIERMKRMSGLQIQPFIASKTQIVAAIDQFYKHGSI